MQGLDEFYPPYQYGWGWLLLAAGVIAVVLLSWGALLWFTRLQKPPKQAPVETPAAPIVQDVLTQLRYEYAAGIDQIMVRYQSGHLSAKGANHELSAIVRQFVNEYSGLEAPVMTLTDLIARGVHPALIDAIQRHYYPSIFRKDLVVDPLAGADAARAVVASWH